MGNESVREIVGNNVQGQAFEIVRKCKFNEDMVNSDWKNKLTSEEKLVIINNLKSTHLRSMPDFIIEDLALKLQPMTFNRGHILKRKDLEIDFMYFICSGELGVYQQSLLLNRYKPGSIVCDPELNYNVTASS